jgi:hypothetical protein
VVRAGTCGVVRACTRHHWRCAHRQWRAVRGELCGVGSQHCVWVVLVWMIVNERRLGWGEGCQQASLPAAVTDATQLSACAQSSCST